MKKNPSPQPLILPNSPPPLPNLHLPNHPLHSGHEISLDAISPLF